MTSLVTLLLGAGVLLIASALECQPIIATFQQIVSGQAIDWTGSKPCAGTTPVTGNGTTTTTAPNAVGQTPGPRNIALPGG